jgi:hypothetical protein
MPLFNFKCDCGTKVRKLLPVAPGAYPCPACLTPMMRDSVAPTSRSTEVLDNGMMSRPLERLDNAEEIFRDRARTDPRDID